MRRLGRIAIWKNATALAPLAMEFRGFGQESALIGDLEWFGELHGEIMGTKAHVEKYMQNSRNKIPFNRLDSFAN